MNLRLLRVVGLLSAGAGCLAGCLSAPSYPETPAINFESIRLQRFVVANSTVPIDSVYITVNFQDGDGDLGLNSVEAQTAPYGSKTLAAVNYINTAFIKNPNAGGRFDSARTFYNYLPKSDLYSLFDHLSPTTDNRKSPLRGTLTRAYGFYLGSPYLPGQEIKFRVSIYDRALNRSNEVETTSLIISPR
ncbi:hypothetical protein [Hymenobacter bucti]|uniref:Uncharacterized protein n=1 Tax=Hymenobacter bucti TaxID=1844114 RepID=A0ABW4QRH3_9BACT